jgi:hypothetical protein
MISTVPLLQLYPFISVEQSSTILQSHTPIMGTPLFYKILDLYLFILFLTQHVGARIAQWYSAGLQAG